MTTISVIVPAYNAERTILKTIESIQEQTFKDLEIIVINDGSIDRTLEILDTVEDQRLKVYSYPNGGLPTARNRGIAHATGDYISFIDADDLWTKDKLEKQLLALQKKPAAGVAYSWVVYMVEALDNPDHISFAPDEKVTFTGNIYPKLLLGNFIGNGSNILARREAIESVGEFEPTFNSCADWDYYLRLAAKWHFILVPEPQILYRKTAGTMSTNPHVIEVEGMGVLKKAYQTSSINLQQQKNRSLANFSLYCGRLYLNSNYSFRNMTQARERFWQAIRLYPAILLKKDIQILLAKLLLKQALPADFVKVVIPVLKKPCLVKDPRQ